MFYRIFLIAMNSVMLYIYADYNLQEKNSLPKDGWVYIIYVFVYDLLMIILLLGVVGDKLFMALFILSFMLQNIAVSQIPSEIPFWGTYSNIALVMLGFVLLRYKIVKRERF
jgi:hypothetical protein